jgi:hypothetical protein
VRRGSACGIPGPVRRAWCLVQALAGAGCTIAPVPSRTTARTAARTARWWWPHNAELEAQQAAAEEADKAARKAIREQKRQQRKETGQQRVDALKAKFHKQ